MHYSYTGSWIMYPDSHHFTYAPCQEIRILGTEGCSQTESSVITMAALFESDRRWNFNPSAAVHFSLIRLIRPPAVSQHTRYETTSLYATGRKLRHTSSLSSDQEKS